MADPEVMPEQNSNPPASLAGFLLRSFDYTTREMSELPGKVRTWRGVKVRTWRGVKV